MKKIIRLLLVLFFVVMVVIQFFRPEKNISELSENHIFNKENLPTEVKGLLQNACLDCHSDNTKHVWYNSVAPVSWMINKHIVEGKQELNFSNWGEFDVFDKIATLEEICSETERGKMPIKGYVQMHKEAKLSEEQLAMLCAWTEKLSEELLEEVE